MNRKVINVPVPSETLEEELGWRQQYLMGNLREVDSSPTVIFGIIYV